ncbi:hypothetical protein [Marinifilum flexuosum]|uniref:hypothetical protein n=1 Tax=Marinifilum flexuosum TaxID=1117708 RepID=UPI00249327DD|nr:hypothetical protein [Marinifilum flexuosum]
MTKKEVNQKIISVLPNLMKTVISKTKYRAIKAKKKGFKDENSCYNIKGVEFWVYYFKDKGEDVSRIFCRYHDNKGPIYALINVFSKGRYSIIHFLKHAIDQYNSRLELGFNHDEIKKILFHMAKHGTTMARLDLDKIDEDWLDTGWTSENGLWLGKSENKTPYSPTYISLAKTFINNDLIREDQEGTLNDEKLKFLKKLEMEIGGDEYANKRILQLIDLFKNKN